MFVVKNFKNIDWKKALRWVSSHYPPVDKEKVNEGSWGIGGSPMMRTDRDKWAKHLAVVAEWWLDAPSDVKKNASGVGAHLPIIVGQIFPSGRGKLEAFTRRSNMRSSPMLAINTFGITIPVWWLRFVHVCQNLTPLTQAE